MRPVSVRAPRLALYCAAAMLGLVIVAAVTSSHAAVPLVLSHQGRLLDASDQPLNGTFTLIYSIYEAPTGGVPLWTEDHVGVQVVDGLFSVELGGTVPLSADLLTGPGGGGGGATRYLQVQVAGEAPMLPRTPLLSAPYSVASSRVSGDIYTTPGHVDIGDLDGDGRPDLAVSSGPDSTVFDMGSDISSRVMIHKIHMGGSRLAQIVSADSIASVLDKDSDGDGVVDNAASLSVTSTTSRLAIQTKGTSAKRLMAGWTSDDTSVSMNADCDDDGDGVAETSMLSSVQRKSGSIVYLDREGNEVLRSIVGVDSTRSIISTDHDSDDDGIAENEAALQVMPGSSRVAIRSKGTGADKDRVMSITATTDGISSAVHRSDYDDDGDGVPEQEISQTLTPVSSNVAIKTKGTGADHNRASITNTTDTSGAVSALSVDLDGDGLADRSIREECDDADAGITVARADSEIKIRHKGWDGTIRGRMAIEEGGTIEVDFGGDGVGFVSNRFGIGVLSPSHPLEHSSGAHLTAGGVWTNASDANLKENFRPVDAQQLLEKVDQLPISQWNYKNEPDEITHIGPTAQDFKRVFGLGENDKTISTIDPAGISLVAIQALYDRVRQLESENAAIKAQLAANNAQMTELMATVKTLASRQNGGTNNLAINQ